MQHSNTVITQDSDLIFGYTVKETLKFLEKPVCMVLRLTALNVPEQAPPMDYHNKARCSRLQTSRLKGLEGSSQNNLTA